MQGLDDAGALVTGGLIAHEIDGGGHGGHGAHGAGTACPNCGAVRAGDFCQACGQPAHLHRDLMGFAHDVLHGVFHFEGKFWTTLPLLAFRPGTLMRRYIDGERAKFVTPMAMFLFSVFLMFTIVSNLSSWSMDGGNDLAGMSSGLGETRRGLVKEIDTARTDLAGLRRTRASLPAGTENAALDIRIDKAGRRIAGLEGVLDYLPGADEASPHLDPALKAAPAPTREAAIEGWFQRKVAHFRENPKLTFYKMKTAGYKYSWALIPLSLPFLWAMFLWKRGVGLYDHAVFATYSIAFMSLLVVALTLVTSVTGGVVSGLAWTAFFLVPPIHMYKQLRHGYRLGRFAAGWRTLMLLVIVTITSTCFFLLLLYLGVAD